MIAFTPFDGPPADDFGMAVLVVVLAFLVVAAFVLLFGPERL
jgi:hypothetical protein